mmetsp:Transcript_21441/g.48368  ORF Transcript_21441/g.48368 Transcript_21441/m.48368 type:complete len:293 (-) Transcript_21441:532-1410(-)
MLACKPERFEARGAHEPEEAHHLVLGGRGRRRRHLRGRPRARRGGRARGWRGARRRDLGARLGAAVLGAQTALAACSEDGRDVGAAPVPARTPLDEHRAAQLVHAEALRPPRLAQRVRHLRVVKVPGSRRVGPAYGAVRPPRRLALLLKRALPHNGWCRAGGRRDAELQQVAAPNGCVAPHCAPRDRLNRHLLSQPRRPPPHARPQPHATWPRLRADLIVVARRCDGIIKADPSLIQERTPFASVGREFKVRVAMRRGAAGGGESRGAADGGCFAVRGRAVAPRQSLGARAR